MEWTVNNVDEWQLVADQVAQSLEYNILLLKGNLGAGKTTFTKYLLNTLGSKDEVSSPTYAIVNEYSVNQGSIFHFDLYRMKTIEEVYDIGIDEYLDNAWLCIIEWPEIYAPEFTGVPHHEMLIENSDTGRKVIFK
ncbi:tRNA (adenosine(37)-N6)-threonylcarbamoyltransferase complex ATPase subunit type 1 TsaE [Marnyiella aurantia]|uniref:tRNA threonylcarbamoyladenosine biosynthesis protein TsaE n=1 Tax=Marnyiella aurantia TaxID=2758037 RepID=A0A7D7LNF9_9FLAO|nr:tRNA (adenosine(37)-N6)-threonylcarbamoyltransferase complex ATPase subunit type 1 TsaE [Marnyiella aurantia]MBA5247363.1 tRNA (adenosine(37)-N6)-threonylcarbamoyltransferase complex ATPase subunit type 1 TsaE [Marnyiella aurantia]QMS99122.1 tRNA (adenosine(37)-N6)-threonylcarbamoyltransferase complex ATPase subunit type 1 TsaE [Marnyiella aurantia]